MADVAKFRHGSFPQPYGKDKCFDGEGAMPFVQVVDVGEDMRLVQNIKIDKFDALPSSITEGLPRDIKFRQKRYSNILSFPKSEV